MAGCARTSPPSPSPALRDPCRFISGSANPLDTFTVALADSVDLSRAPAPTNDSERFVFRQLFPTLIRVDCEDQVQPGLATRWQGDSTGRIWTFTLRHGARLPDGTPLSASAVAESWRQRWSAIERLGVDSLAVRDPQRLAVTVRTSRDSLPRLFAQPDLAVTPARENWQQSLSSETLVYPGSDHPVVKAEITRSGDLRDALDAGADLVLSRDPAVIDYAASRPEFETLALPWDRTYVLLQKVGVEPIPAPIWSDSVRRSLADRAVRTEARAAQPPFWWHGPCAIDTSMHVTMPSTARLVYQRNDPVARQLAERLIALAGDSLQLRVVGLDSEAFSAARSVGGDRGYIVALPRRSLTPCTELASWTTGSHLVPLVDTRPHAVVRRGSPPLTVDWDGTIRLVPQEPAGIGARP